MIKLPEEFLGRMKKILGNDYDKFIFSYSQPAQRGVRINTEKISVAEFSKITPFGFEDTQFSDNCKYFLSDDRFGKHPYSHAGLFYMQEPSAMLPVSCIDKDISNWKCLDLCAAPGGKSGQLANLISDGLLISNEVVSSRAKILFSNLERQGFKNTIVTSDTPQKFADVLPSFFNLVLVDAPCSGEGMFRKDSTAISEWSTANVKACSVRQLEILASAKKCVAPNGILIYSTCTFSIDENENVVNNFLKENTNFKLIKVSDKVKKITTDGIVIENNNELKKCRRAYPHITRGEGQFIAVFQKNDEDTPNASKNKSLAKLNTKEEKLVSDFLTKYTSIKNLELRVANGNIYAIPENTPELRNIKIVNCGVKIGSISKNRFEPYHSLFMAFGNYFKNKFNLNNDSVDVEKYLKGETLYGDSVPNGWGIITVDAFQLGGYKAVDGQLKNHYPKGLRR